MPMRTSAPDAGFTLMEMLLVLVILAMAADLILTRFHPAPPATALSDAAVRMLLARVSAERTITSTSVDATPWSGGPVRFSADGTAQTTDLASPGRSLRLLPTGGFRLAP